MFVSGKGKGGRERREEESRGRETRKRERRRRKDEGKKDGEEGGKGTQGVKEQGRSGAREKGRWKNKEEEGRKRKGGNGRKKRKEGSKGGRQKAGTQERRRQEGRIAGRQQGCRRCASPQDLMPGKLITLSKFGRALKGMPDRTKRPSSCRKGQPTSNKNSTQENKSQFRPIRLGQVSITGKHTSNLHTPDLAMLGMDDAASCKLPVKCFSFEVGSAGWQPLDFATYIPFFGFLVCIPMHGSF